MLLGELIEKCDSLKEGVDLCFNTVVKGEVEGDNVSSLINYVFNNIVDYYNHYYTLMGVINTVDIVLSDGKKINLNRAFTIRDSLKKKISFLEKVMLNNNYNISIKDVLVIKDELVADLAYIESAINKKTWSTNVDI